MWDSLRQVGGHLGLALLLVVNAAGVVMVLMSLPGTWLMVLAMVLAAVWRPGAIDPWTAALVGVMAVAGEVAEFAAAAKGAARRKASRRASALALLGGMVGAALGTFFIPVLVAGTLVGACLGAGIGAYAGERWAGRSRRKALDVAGGAAKGRFWGTVVKVAIALLMWAVVAVAVFVP